jgi:hypothetical protein
MRPAAAALHVFVTLGLVSITLAALATYAPGRYTVTNTLEG